MFEREKRSKVRILYDTDAINLADGLVTVYKFKPSEALEGITWALKKLGLDLSSETKREVWTEMKRLRKEMRKGN